jgi:serine/threonine protein kinase
MTSDRWRRVEDLCHAALASRVEERAAFLVQACAGDEQLQREVESLLAKEPRAAAFLSVPAAAVSGADVLTHAKGTLAGRRLGVYAIGSLLGVGGMGEVYRAHDEMLGREVAIKVLPKEFTADPERRARFEREARILATLNHPHIGAIYGVEESDGVRGLILELVEGETLAERIAMAGRAPSGQRRAAGSNPSGLPIIDVLAITRQIADALDAAHEKGIVHRDLKPANIKIAPDGAVKVLDFGLAKAATSDSAPPDLSESREGAILGTAAYMSPEHARGHSADKRVDIWAFGCVLYEMLTGRLAFPGDTGGHDCDDSRARAGLVGAPAGNASTHSTARDPLSRQGSKAASARHR